MRQILVVDDDPGIRELVTDLLAEEGYAVSVATNGAEALARIRADPCDVVLLDLMMPVMDGWSFLRAYRQEPSFERVPVVVMTAAHDACRSVAQLGAQDCVRKPFDIDQLLRAVEQVA